MMNDKQTHTTQSRRLIPALVLAGCSALALSACNTVEGAGEDIENAGEAIEESAED